MAQIIPKELVEKHNSLHLHIASNLVSCENEIRDRRFRISDPEVERIRNTNPTEERPLTASPEKEWVCLLVKEGRPVRRTAFSMDLQWSANSKVNVASIREEHNHGGTKYSIETKERRRKPAVARSGTPARLLRLVPE